EVGVEGKLGGQASVPGAAGTWKDLTDNLNQLAATLTNQVRAIAEVATAVTKGDLTRSIKVEASGEVAALKDNINEMIRNLKEQTLKNSEQDWLKTNLAKFGRMLQVKGVLELASFERFNPTHLAFLDQLTESIGIVLNTIVANMRTEDLLKQSQSLTLELQQTNQELQEKAALLAHQNAEVERKNSEVEQARQALEDKAKQLALTSKYKNEFLANMSHELRTPLNSLLILSDQLSRNPEGNLTAKQIDFVKTIHSSGNDLLMLI